MRTVVSVYNRSGTPYGSSGMHVVQSESSDGLIDGAIWVIGEM